MHHIEMRLRTVHDALEPLVLEDGLDCCLLKQREERIITLKDEIADIVLTCTSPSLMDDDDILEEQ